MPSRMPRLNTARKFSARRINRAPSPWIARSIPWITIILGSLISVLPHIASAPILPPIGFMILLAWLQIRPGLLPIWAGLPLGIVDDMFSGQPFGSAVLLWSIAIIAMDMIEAKMPWRNFLIDWLSAAAFTLVYIGLGVAIAHSAIPLFAMIPQLLLAVFLYPLVGRFVALCDRLRLLPLAKVR